MVAGADQGRIWGGGWGVGGGGWGGGGGARGPRPPLFSCIFENFLTLSLTFGHKCSHHHQFLRPPLSGFSGAAPADFHLPERSEDDSITPISRA